MRSASFTEADRAEEQNEVTPLLRSTRPQSNWERLKAKVGFSLSLSLSLSRLCLSSHNTCCASISLLVPNTMLFSVFLSLHQIHLKDKSKKHFELQAQYEGLDYEESENPLEMAVQ